MNKNKMNQRHPKAVQEEAAYHCGYQQALNDFGIKDLEPTFRPLNCHSR
jgi:hypothetical protein